MLPQLSSFLNRSATCVLLFSAACAQAQVIDVTGIALDAVNATGDIRDDAFLTHFTVNGTTGGTTPTGANRTIGEFGGGTTYDVRTGWEVLPMVGVEAEKVYFGADMTPEPPFAGGVDDVDAYMNDFNIATAVDGTETEFVINIHDINVDAIGDGIPDIIMIAIAGKAKDDEFRMLDANGNPVGGDPDQDGWIKIEDWNKIENDGEGKVLVTDRWDFKDEKLENKNKDKDIHAMAFDLGIFLNESTTAADIANTVTQIAIRADGDTNFAVIAYDRDSFSALPEPGSVLPLFGVLAAHVLFSRSRGGRKPSEPEKSNPDP